MAINAVLADYQKTGVSDYDGNPFIEALPPIPSVNEIAKSLKTKRIITELDLEKSNSIRIHEIANIAHNFFQPISQHISLSEKISIMIRGGYIGRNPNTGDMQRHLQNGYERILSKNLAARINNNVKSTAESALLVGCSGSGKTTALSKILNTYPQVVYHESSNVEQVVFLKIDCSHNGSLKEICFNFFRALDNAIDTNYENRFSKSRIGVEQLLGIMAQLANAHALGLLVIDEIQHLLRSQKGASENAINFFVTLVNTISIPVLLIGTPRANEIFESNLRSARRAAGVGTQFWSPLNPHKDEQGKVEWKGFTDNLWKLQYLKKRDLKLTDEMREVWFDLSQGVTDIVVKLFVLAQIRAISTGQERLTPALMHKIYLDELKPVHPMLSALRSGKPENIARFSDLAIPSVDVRLLALQISPGNMFEKSPDELAMEKLSSSAEQQLYSSLCQLYDSDSLVMAIKATSRENSDGDVKTMLSGVLQLLAMGDTPQQTKAKPKRTTSRIMKFGDWEGLEDCDLRYIFKQKLPSADIHKELEKSGYIFDVNSLLRIAN